MSSRELRVKIYKELRLILSESYNDNDYLVFTLSENKKPLMEITINNVASDLRKNLGHIYYKDVYDYIIKHYLKKKIELL